MFKNKRFISPMLIILFIISFSACQPKEQEQQKPRPDTLQGTQTTNYPLRITDSYDRELTLDDEPMKIVSVAPNITETIFALGQGGKLIGRTDFCDYPDGVENIESIGSLMEPNIEKIADLKPDLVIASTHFREDALKKLEELGLKVIVLYGEESFDGVYDLIGKMGEIINTKAQADQLITNMKDRIHEVQNKITDKNRPSVYYVVGFGQFGDFTAGGDTFMSQMIEIAGGENAAKDVKGWQYSVEKLVEKNPDILVCSIYGNEKEQIMNTNGYKDLTAVTEDRLYEIDKNLLERQGPRLAEGMETLARIIHPEVFK